MCIRDRMEEALRTEKRQGLERLDALPWVREMADVEAGNQVLGHMFQAAPSLMSRHFVGGLRSPFSFRVGVDPEAGRHPRVIWAVYVGEYGTNAQGMVQGGAMAAMFDFAMACYGTMVFREEGGAFSLTKSLAVRYRRPAVPVPGVYRVVVECEDLDEQKGLIKLRATCGSGEGDETFATAECELVDMRRRAAWKANSKL
eukprot:TRINITY_DN10104_c0_g1_i1.p2 TRINITY_DN10104_c0_g1~~TRINITY_DN10104_c0_g1_i1.p2  ORF type:complete len:200 (+),score=52.65 TRINITY_DN10104_c0_g1_i1:183-782(+)